MLDTTLIGVLLFGISVIALQQHLASLPPKPGLSHLLLLAAILLSVFCVILPALLLGIPAAVYFLAAAGITSASTLIAGYTAGLCVQNRWHSAKRWVTPSTILLAIASAIPSLLKLAKTLHL